MKNHSSTLEHEEFVSDSIKAGLQAGIMGTCAKRDLHLVLVA